MAPSGVVVKRPPVDVIMALEVVEKLSLNSRQVPIFRPDTEKRPLVARPLPCRGLRFDPIVLCAGIVSLQTYRFLKRPYSGSFHGASRPKGPRPSCCRYRSRRPLQGALTITMASKTNTRTSLRLLC